MKKIVMALLMAVCCLNASAQFEQGTKYMNTSLSNLGLSFQKNHFSMGVNATAGYFLQDAWMVYGQLGYEFENVKGSYNDTNTFTLGLGGRYYILQNGLYLNLGLKYGHSGSWGMYNYPTLDEENNIVNMSAYQRAKSNNLYLTPELGYCFYLNHYLSIEPAVYYDLSLNHFSDGSKLGIRVGFGYYF